MSGEIIIKEEQDETDTYEDYEVLLDFETDYGDVKNVEPLDVYNEVKSNEVPWSVPGEVPEEYEPPAKKRNFVAELAEIRNSLMSLTKTVETLVVQNKKLSKILLCFDPQMIIDNSQESLLANLDNEQLNDDSSKYNKFVDAKAQFGIPVSNKEELDLLGQKIVNDPEFKSNLVNNSFSYLQF